ncbi:MAG: N-6 DNA methylase [Rhodothermales bacterium]
MSTRTRTPFQSVKTEGAILPMDLLQRVADQDADLGGLRPQDYGLAKNEKLGEAASRSWNRLQGLWAAFRDERLRLDALEDARGTTETREGWLLPLFEELGYGRLKTETYEIEGKRYPVSHGYRHLPVHLLSYKVDLDRKSAGVAGAATYAPHAMTQELLNRSDEHLWAILTNGLKLRLLRDNASLTRQAYVEFDLEAMFEGEAYADFAVLWLTAHASRTEGATPEACWLERWSVQAHEQGTRALDALRDGVQQAIEHLGAGFIAHRENEALREALRSGDLDPQDYYRQLLRLVYRLIFLFTAEDREALLDPKGDDAAKERYAKYYSTAALRALAEKRRGSARHGDRWEQLKLIMRALGETGEPRLALPALGSFLWSDDAIGTLAQSKLANEPFLEAVRALSLVEQDRVRRSVDYKHLGPEELGGIYESLLELQPQLNLDAHAFVLEAVAGSERKTTGSYYTPEGLIQALLDTALDPVLDRAEKADDPEASLLALKVCDPAVGSGHFLIAAAHRIAGRLARVRAAKADGGEPTPEQRQHALRDVIARCVYGVDLNPMALELCKVNLWLESLEPGKPLSFLDHHLQVGNGLLGATPAALREGIPDEAFKPITGDVKAYANEYKAQNRTFRKKRQHDLFAAEAMPWERLGNMPQVIAELDALPNDSVEAVQDKAKRYAAAVHSQAYEHARLLADAWCAAFVWPKWPSDDLAYPIHEEVYRKIERNPHATPDWMRREVQRLAERYRFLHWHLAFPDVFRVPGPDETPTDETAGWRGGFDCVLGNPPWERVKLQEKEFFAGVRPDIAGARNKAARTTLIKQLETEDPALFEAFREAQRQAEGESTLLRDSGVYPLCGRGDVNTYAVFAERFMQLVSEAGRAGIVTPTVLVTSDTTKAFFDELVQNQRIESILSFTRISAFFRGTKSPDPFCLLTIRGRNSSVARSTFEFGFDLDSVGAARDADRISDLSAEDIVLLNPNTKTAPLFRWRRDAELTKALYRRVPVFIVEGSPEENPWRIRFSTMFHMANDSDLFRAREVLESEGYRMEGNRFVGEAEDRYLPLYEPKLFHQYNHRYNTFDQVSADSRFRVKAQAVSLSGELKNPNVVPLPRYWVERKEVISKLDKAPAGLITFRNIVNTTTNRRTAVFTVLPLVAANHACQLIEPECEWTESTLLLSCLNSFVFDYATRQSLGGTNFSHFILKQLPVLPPETYLHPCPWLPEQMLADWIRPRVLELTYTAWDLQPFARDVGYDGPPFVWDEARREKLRAELDAAFFHLYLGTPEAWAEEPEALRQSFPTPRAAVAYVMDTFPIVKRKDEKAHGSYRTKDMILAVYDRLQQAAEAGAAYETILDPPPASPAVAHPPREVEA